MINKSNRNSIRNAAMATLAICAICNAFASASHTGTSPIIVKKAVFGLPFDPKRQVDVTSAVKKQISSNATTYKVSYFTLSLKKDPAFGIRKQLVLTYIQSGITKTASAFDGLAINFRPTPINFTNAKGQKIVIVKGTYGDLAHPARCIDITSLLNDSASKPKGFPITKFDHNYVGNEDPAFGFRKSARVDYTVNGKPATKTVLEGEKLDL